MRKREHAIPEESERVTGKVGGDVSIEASGDSYGLLVNKKVGVDSKDQKGG